MARSHRGDAWGTHGQRIGNLRFWPVRCRSLGVGHHSLLVRRARWTDAMHSSSFAVCVGIFWACSKVCAELGAWMYTPKGRQTCAERARPTPDIRVAHAMYTRSALATRYAFGVSSFSEGSQGWNTNLWGLKIRKGNRVYSSRIEIGFIFRRFVIPQTM